MTEQEYCRRAEALKPRLYRTALACLGGESAAIDAVDEAVYKGLLACPRLRREEAFAGWMGRILMNVCNDELRRRRRETPVDTLPERGAGDFDALPLMEALAKLPQELREVVTLRHLTGLTVAETARVLSIPQGTAASRERRALQLLRLELSEEGTP